MVVAGSIPVIIHPVSTKALYSWVLLLFANLHHAYGPLFTIKGR